MIREKLEPSIKDILRSHFTSIIGLFSHRGQIIL